VIEVTARAEIDRPAEQVWTVLADYARDPEWRAGVLEMTPTPAGPVAPGTTTRERMRFAGRELRNDGEVVALTLGRRFVWRTTAGADAEGAREVHPLGEGRCRVELLLRVRPHGVERFTAPLAALLLRRGLRADAARLRALVEREGLSSPRAGRGTPRPSRGTG
jgi:uncharacterized protein YndB with AHSA1/START domain